jgi:hypothetical protein
VANPRLVRPASDTCGHSAVRNKQRQETKTETDRDVLLRCMPQVAVKIPNHPHYQNRMSLLGLLTAMPAPPPAQSQRERGTRPLNPRAAASSPAHSSWSQRSDTTDMSSLSVETTLHIPNVSSIRHPVATKPASLQIAPCWAPDCTHSSLPARSPVGRNLHLLPFLTCYQVTIYITYNRGFFHVKRPLVSRGRGSAHRFMATNMGPVRADINMINGEKRSAREPSSIIAIAKCSATATITTTGGGDPL